MKQTFEIESDDDIEMTAKVIQWLLRDYYFGSGLTVKEIKSKRRIHGS